MRFHSNRMVDFFVEIFSVLGLAFSFINRSVAHEMAAMEFSSASINSIIAIEPIAWLGNISNLMKIETLKI